MPRCLRSSVKENDLGSFQLRITSIQKTKRKLVPKVKAKKYSESSRELNEIIDDNQETIRLEIERLKSLADIDENSSSEGETGEGESSKDQLGSVRSLTWDNQGDLNSPLKDTSDLLDLSLRFEEDQDSIPPALSRERSKSVSVNRASYLTLESGEILVQPVCRNLNRRFNNLEESEPCSLASQDSFLESNLKAKEIESLNLIAEEVENLDDEVFVNQDLEAEKMDENTFKEHMKKLKSDHRKVKRKINEYTADDVTIEDQDEFRTYLKEARDEYDAFKVCADAVIDLLDIDNDALRVDEIEALVSELSTAIKKNEKEVKEKITEVKAQAAINAPRSEEDKRYEAQKIEKMHKRMEFLNDKAAANELKVVNLKPEEMTDNEVREKYFEAKDWEKACKEMIKSKEEIQEDCIGLDINAEIIDNMKKTVSDCVTALQTQIDNLKLEDKTRGLFSAVSKNLSRENVVFPEKFSGEPGDNVFKFKEKFLQALLDSQVREKDKVEVLRKNLVGHAKNLIGAHYTDIDKALKSLEDYFGDEQRIWDKSKEKFEKYFGDNPARVWGKYGDEKRVMAISKVIEFLREAMELAEAYEELKTEIYHSSTLKLILKIMPHDYYEKFNDLISGQKISMKEKFLSAKDLLEVKKSSAIHADNFGRDDRTESRRLNGANQIDARGESFGGNRRGYDDREEADKDWGRKDWRRQEWGGNRGRRQPYGQNGGKDRRGGLDKNICRFCGGSCCQTEWHGLGCVELYRLKTLSERLDWLVKLRLCMKCGFDYYGSQSSGPHQCKWFGKLSVRCQTDTCFHGAVVCRKMHKMNMSSALQNWLRNMSINPKDISYSLVVGSSTTGVQNIEFKHNSTVSSSIPISKIPRIEREKLQKGVAERWMTDGEVSEYFENELRQSNGMKPDVRPIPEGESIFIMNVFKGKTRPIVAFIDGGCNCWVAKEGVPEEQLTSVKMRSGPIPCGVASGISVNAKAEWASLIPLADGGAQAVRGLTMPNVTQEMPEVNMLEVFNTIKKQNKDVKTIQNIRVPKVLSGKVDMIIGIKYQNIYPELVHQFPNGLAVYKSKLLPAAPGEVGCIGGPVGALEDACHKFGGNSLRYIVQLTQVMSSYKPRMEFFPETSLYKEDLIDDDIPGIYELIDYENKMKAKEQVKTLYNKCKEDSVENPDNVKEKKAEDKVKAHDIKICNVCEEKLVYYVPTTVQSELKKFMQQEQVGLDTSYKCPKCRACSDCMKGSGYENISIKQEAEQELIKQSVDVNLDSGRAMAELPFKVGNPEEFLADNHNVAYKRMISICRKYHQDVKIKNEILAAFEKLRNKGHLKYYEDLNIDQRKKLETQVGYTIPWDVVWKESSLSTPARTVFDASSKTSTGLSLNDVLATGTPDLVRLLDVLLDWHVGPVAFVGDVSQFYCSIGLLEKSWPFQKLLLKEDLNPNGKLIRAVIIAAIFGVCSSGGQSEEAVKKFCEIIKEEHEDIARLLLKSRYVDDIMKSKKSTDEVKTLINKTEEELKKIDMKIKGWCISGEDPPVELSEDKKSVQFSGMTWFPKIDSFKLNIASLHFGKKVRGKTSSELDIYDIEKHGSIGEFLKDKEVTRKKCTSVVARLYDMFGKLEPLKLRLKSDLRRLIKENPAWDDSISSNMKLRWEENFKIIQDCRDIMYMRCSVPVDAVSLKARVWILGDAADGIMVGVYVGFELPGKRWSCTNVLGKSLLVPDDWTIPKKELQALTTASNIKVVIERALDDWVDVIRIGCDSQIALSWCIYENVKLNVFHRHRVNNIRSKVSLDQLFHVQGSENCSDIGTRPDSVTTESLLPGSPWLSGKEWMRQPHEDSIKAGIIKSVQDIKLTNEAKKTMREGIIFDQFENDESKIAFMKINSIDINKVAEREAFSRYVYPPLKRSFIPTVRIVSMVLLAVRKFKEGGIRRRITAGKADPSELERLKPDKVKFTIFPVIASEINEDDEKKQECLVDTFGSGVRCAVVKKIKQGRKKKLKKTEAQVRLSDEDLSAGLEYLYRKATQEILQFENLKDINKIGVMKEEILYCSTRVLEGQELKTVGCLKDSLDLETFTGIKFCVPLVSKQSPLAVSIAMHIHYNVCKHKGVESTYRLSLQHARIMQGKQLFKEVSDDCIYCKKLRQKYVRQLMGPLSDTQLCISPIFYVTFIDMWGPLAIYCPGYERRTRNRQQKYEVHMLVMACAVTGAVNCQIIEKRDTGAVLDGLNRFFHEVCVPKVCYPDKDGALMKALREGEIDILDMQGRLHRERGIYFETCLPQGHYQHGRIERRIRMLQESLERSDMKNSRCTATGWQTICKAIEHEVNSVPMGFLYHQGSANPLLRVLCPNLLKNSTFTDRAPKGLFSIPNAAEDLMTRIENIYNLWFQVWNCEYLPLVMDRPKWHVEDENLKENDLVYFKLTDSKLAADWRMGKVEYVNIGRDGRVRSVGISYKIMVEKDEKVFNEDFEWRHAVVERPARAIIKLVNIEDTSLMENIAKIQELVQEILYNKKTRSALDSNENPNDMLEADGQAADDARAVRNDEEDKEFERKIGKVKKRKSEVERLLDDMKSKDAPDDERKVLRSKKNYPFLSRQKKNALFSVQRNLASSINWPQHIYKEEQIGLATAAILDGVTRMIAEGAEVLCSMGAESRHAEGGGESRYDDNFDVFLL